MTFVARRTRIFKANRVEKTSDDFMLIDKQRRGTVRPRREPSTVSFNTKLFVERPIARAIDVVLRIRMRKQNVNYAKLTRWLRENSISKRAFLLFFFVVKLNFYASAKMRSKYHVEYVYAAGRSSLPFDPFSLSPDPEEKRKFHFARKEWSEIFFSFRASEISLFFLP